MIALKILLVGAGQLGSRHLQALMLLDFPIDLAVVDPNANALRTSRHRVEEVSGHEKHRLSYQTELPFHCNFYDLVIVATSASIRRHVVESVLERYQLRWMILEKILFQSAEDCHAVEAMLKARKVLTWVNAPRRIWPDYIKLKKQLKGNQIYSITCDGGGWGMACNTYHFLDLFAWLCDAEWSHCESSLSGEKVIPSKREGYYEIQGSLHGHFGDLFHFSVYDHGNTVPIMLTVHSAVKRFCIFETTKSIENFPSEISETTDFLTIEPIYQSQLTHHVVAELRARGACSLTPIEEAVRLHSSMLEAFMPAFAALDLEERICPIT